MQSLGLQVPQVNTVIQTPAHQKLGGGAQTHTGLFFLKDTKMKRRSEEEQEEEER